MRLTAFLSRFAFICNLLFVVCLLIQHTRDFIQNDAISGVIIVLGWFPVAPLLNLFVCILYLTRALRKLPLGVRPWLVTVNILFFAAQILVHLILV
ncbi:hypothetical protein [Sediminibacterium soli]|uniref:hypothetical protein n=1 Tax=Sediminibacterium soli TaxID=2698829 RepID=UPI00137B3E30|nr:hypothetical protein [Sediminibacterium soli]NCI46608.1 hypothetical protein [Sediminibacterium soli]